MVYGADTKWFELECYTQSDVFSGSICCPAGLRIIELLNSRRHDNGSKFIEFINVSDSKHEDSYCNRSIDYIRKGAVQFVAVSDANLGRGIGANDGPKRPPFFRKSVIPASLHLQTYTLHGSIHHAQGQTVQDVLNDDAEFLPLTDVTIVYECNIYGTRPFVAVNKEQITSCEALPAPSYS